MISRMSKFSPHRSADELNEVVRPSVASKTSERLRGFRIEDSIAKGDMAI